MNPIEEHIISCPHCGESFEIVVDCSQLNQHYIEDCFVCCKPINIAVSMDLHGEPDASLMISVEQAQ